MTRRLRRAVAAVAVAGLLAASVPPARAAATERELGERFMLEIRSSIPLVEDPALREFVTRVGQRVLKAAGPTEFDFQFFVVDHPALNAFAVPGGYVFIFTGLLAKLSREDELAGVLAHEVSHVTAHHIVRLQQEGQVWNVAALLGLFLGIIHPVLGAGALAAAQTAQLKYSRQFEQEADFLGIKVMSDAGYDPHGMPDFFKQILAEQRLNPVGVPAYMLTHPLTDERVTNANNAITAQKLRIGSAARGSAIALDEVKAMAKAAGGPKDVVLKEYQDAADAQPKDAERQFLLGRVAATVGQLDLARRALERARDLGGLGDRVDRPLGMAYARLGLNAQARSVLERAIQHAPDDATARLEHGRVLEALGDETGALKEYQRAADLDGELDEAHRLAGLALGRKGEQAEGFYHLARSALLRGDLSQALSHYRRTESLLPEGSSRLREVEDTIEQLKPIVSEREREEMERQRERRRGGLGARQAGLP